MIPNRVIFEDISSVTISPLASIGTPAEHYDITLENADQSDETKVIIHSGVRVNEFVTINCGLDRNTVIGKNSYLLAKSHVGHDSILKEGVVLSTGSIVGGRSIIGNHCYLGLNASTHQRAILGDYCILGANSFFKGESPAGITWAGVPAKPIKVNIVGIERHCPENEREAVITIAENFITNYKKERLT